jgi:hypothetical protein
MCDSAAHSVMVIPLVTIRSINRPDCNVILHTNLSDLEHFSLYVGATLSRLEMWY